MRITTMPSLIGFDRMFDEIQRVSESAKKAVSFPPYNLKKVSDNQYQLEMAVAGFSKTDIDITIEGDQLIVKGEVKADPNANYIYKEIAERAFERSFTLADSVVVKNAGMFNGLLKIMLEQLVPDHKKPRKVDIVEQDTPDIKTVDQAKLAA
jgi:molecular chaperone IbpA